MRDIREWSRRVVGEIKKRRPENSSMKPSILCEIELGLYLLSRLSPEIKADELWVYLTGYPFPILVNGGLTIEQRQMIGNARHLLPSFKRRYLWERALSRYRQFEERLRLYMVEKDYRFSRRDVTVCANRCDDYERALREQVLHARRSIKQAEEGNYWYSRHLFWNAVKIPSNLVFDNPIGHDLDGRGDHSALTVSWLELLETACWMDSEYRSRGLHSETNWEKRLKRVRLECFTKNGTTFEQAQSLTFNGVMHLIGMVSSGKSTLMDILAVWAARNNLQVTLVVGDVINAINKATQFVKLGLTAAPILGRSNRDEHIERLHNIQSSEEKADWESRFNHTGFRWLSTACPLDELGASGESLNTLDYPCIKLYKSEEGQRKKINSCPLYAVCPFSRGQRELVESSIWVATPGSMVYSRVDASLNKENITFAELIYRRSNLVIIDEADRVQAQLDRMFSPEQVLVCKGEPGKSGWLSDLYHRVVTVLNQEGRGQLRDDRVERWIQAHDVAQNAANRIYGLILQESVIKTLVKNKEYFTAWLLFSNLSDDLIENRENSSLPGIFCDYLDDPLREESNHALAELARNAIFNPNNENVRTHIKNWIGKQDVFNKTLSDISLEKVSIKLHFTLLVAVLQDRLNQIVIQWKEVEEVLKLGNNNSMMFHRPPRDYDAVLPQSPMGNILGFQYIQSSDLEQSAGEFRFFRCMGVGRWLMLRFHELFNADGLVGPHVLLLSGSSWAGHSPVYHIQVPVTGVLHSPKSEVDAIDKSRFEFLPFLGEEEQAIKVSGKQGDARNCALHRLLEKLIGYNKLGGPSRLEIERDKWLEQGRKRILLVVGSYEEAKESRRYIESIRQDLKGKVINLIRDEETTEAEGSNVQNTLQRGLVNSFAETGGWILIAPLLAIERGHNILNENEEAAIGSVYFLVRPHPRPDDIDFALHSINRWAVSQCEKFDNFGAESEKGPPPVKQLGTEFRNEAFRKWRYLLKLPMIFSTLPFEEKKDVTWNLLVAIWQVIGRLVRSGKPARVFFCDAAFAAHMTEPKDVSNPDSSLIINMQRILRPYFEEVDCVDSKERALVEALYGPLYKALKKIKGVSDGI
jgi:hypothetical protein